MNTAKKKSIKRDVEKIVIGIDEAGRGPLAGPVAVGVCALLDIGLAKKIFKGVKESKQLNQKSREEWLLKMRKSETENVIAFDVSMVSAKVIDEKGISFAINKALERALDKVVKKTNKTTDKILDESLHILILLDGGLKAPARFVNQRTIIKGDEKEMSIALASIGAKVTRDRYMEKIGDKKDFEKYNFNVHKGYGTRPHRQVILRFGLSAEHRASFCKNILESEKEGVK